MQGSEPQGNKDVKPKDANTVLHINSPCPATTCPHGQGLQSPSDWRTLIFTSSFTFWQRLGKRASKSNCRSYEPGETKRSEQEGSACSSHQMAEQLRAAEHLLQRRNKRLTSISLSVAERAFGGRLDFPIAFFSFPDSFCSTFLFSPKRHGCALQRAVEMLLIGSTTKTQLYGSMPPYPEYSAPPIKRVSENRSKDRDMRLSVFWKLALISCCA